jgi:hypothetical protein
LKRNSAKPGDSMKRYENRLRKLEETTSDDARNVVIVAYGPGETAADAAERHFARRPEDRGSPRILCINTGVARSENGQ